MHRRSTGIVWKLKILQRYYVNFVKTNSESVAKTNYSLIYNKKKL